MADLQLTKNHNLTTEALFQEIEKIWIKLGRQPLSTEININISNISLNTFSRRFGSWRGALKAFVEYINSDKDFEETEYKNNTDDLEQKDENEIKYSHKTKRDINLKIRFKVMQRDNFKCCACGASPAKDPEVELHIDHIKPWSKGGETEMENLQTLCSKCNLGKSDLL